jgi:crotonobetaine/carnitine-CoA ligase
MGDIGHVDAQGWLFFHHRKGSAIRRNGDFINPSEVEKALAEHPGIADVFVYGVPAASGAPGEKDVVAAIVPTGAKPLDPDTVFAHCRRWLPSNSVPSVLQVVAQIPKTASEKPLQRLLAVELSAAGAVLYHPATSRQGAGVKQPA